MTTSTQTRDPDTKNMKDETRQMIAPDKVEGTPLYDQDGEKLGTVRKVMIGKRDGKVRCAVVGYGGMLGMGEDNYPVPWESLEYDTELGGYKLNRSRNEIDTSKAPSYKQGEEPNWSEDFDNSIRLYYMRAV